MSYGRRKKDIDSPQTFEANKNQFIREAMSVGKIPRFSEASRDQIVNKTWVNKQLTGMLVYWVLTLWHCVSQSKATLP